jgi:hypothetical protein
VDIILHPDKPPIGDGSTVELSYLLSYILVKLTCTRAQKLDGLEKSVIPVEPASIKFQIRVKNLQKEMVTQTICQRLSLPDTADVRMKMRRERAEIMGDSGAASSSQRLY